MTMPQSPSYVAPLTGGRNGPDVPLVTSMHPTLNMNEPSNLNGNSVIGGATSLNNGNALGEDNSVINSYADNMAYVDSLNKEERYMQKAKAMFDDDGSGNTGIEIIRLNKKFDIFMKRFMRAEEDIKEVK
jgi:hypothetical protein